jgi:hypothetical protein
MKKKNVLISTMAIVSICTFTASSSFAATDAVVVQGPIGGGGDITTSFTDTMRKNAAYMAYVAMDDQAQGTYPLITGEVFASKVCSNCAWDYKAQYGSTVQYTYNGLYLRGEDLGNMHYGFVGRGAGFPEWMLKSAAGAYQIYSGTWYIGWYNSYFDDPRDQYWIDYGISMYNNNSWPRSVTPYSSQVDTSLFNLLTQEEKKEIDALVNAKAKKIKEKQKNNQK